LTLDIDQIKRDREAGTDGSWVVNSDPFHFDTASDVVSECGTLDARIGGNCKWQKQEANARRIARVPDLEEAVIAQREEVLLLREVLKAWVDQYDECNPMRTADFHDADCGCLRCCRDNAAAALAFRKAGEGA
jgi:hypothetical protein